MDPVETIPAPEKAKLKPTTTQPIMATMSLDPVEARRTESKQEAVMRLRGGYCGCNCNEGCCGCSCYE